MEGAERAGSGRNLRGATVAWNLLQSRELGVPWSEGRQDRQYTKEGVIRQVFVYPLMRDWRRALAEPAFPPAQGRSLPNTRW